ncbi:hypothetical protein AL755_18190 [Arthrobacter sp. ERGS1:01]|nr:hypothetical protein AL755_18190 [Arthrobacter sp. ERGS1:01]
MVPPVLAFWAILYLMSAPSSAERYSLKAASSPCISWPTGLASMLSVALIRVTPRFLRSAMTMASSVRLRAKRESL